MRRTVLTPTARYGAALLAAFGTLAAYVAVVGVADWELSVTRWFHDRPDAFAVVLRPAMQLGNLFVALAAALVVGARWGRRAGWYVLGATTAAWIVALLAKEALTRPRVSGSMLGAVPRDGAGGWSFPSGHTSVAFAVVVAFIFVIRPHPVVGVPLLALAALTGIARMYVGVHYPLDVVGGVLVGSASACLLTGMFVGKGPLSLESEVLNR